MKKMKGYLVLCLLFIAISLKAQESGAGQVTTDKLAIGVGIGQDYGGFGAHLSYYPHRNIGLFGGLGYNFVGAGYNAGVKLRLVPAKPTAKVTPYLIAMYGYNAVIKVQNEADLNKMFYGPTFGLGIDYKGYSRSKLYYNFGINVPIRGSEVDDYMDDLKNNHNVEFKTGLFPITFSLGFKYILM
jgi:hypothetical protein